MVVLSGLITLIFAIVMQLKVGRHIPPLPPDKKKNLYRFRGRLLWFELVDDIEEVLMVLGGPLHEESEMSDEKKTKL